MKKQNIVLIFGFVLAFQSANFSAHASPDDLVVHEWGTFTSLQGADGALLPWKPLQSSQLPKFVHDWSKPDLNRKAANMVQIGGKGSLVTLQRMETPVVYFYSKQEQTIDLTVKFPQGYITEWFPQATQVSPSLPFTSAAESPSTPIITNSQTPERIIHWSNIQTFPAKTHAKLAQSIPTDSSGSHYFAARETDSDFVRWTPPTDASGSQTESEKFLFYRGAGNFKTPLRVTLKSDDTVSLSNSGKEKLSHLFILKVTPQGGQFVYVPELTPGKTNDLAVGGAKDSLSRDDLMKQIAKSMSRALVESGLYAREADAMVKTWNDSWFQEPGLRVLYVLPRTWTDSTLALKVTPKPSETVRVMVGRAEVLTPAVENELTRDLKRAKQGDPAAATETRHLLKSLGRFAEPAFYRALAKAKPQPQERDDLMVLLIDSQKPD